MAKYSYPVDFEGTFWTIIDGDFYVSTVGNDVTGDGSPKNPFLTIHRAFELAVDGEKIVIGPDEYIRVDGTTTGVNTSGSEVPCRVATTGNISLVSGGLFTIDGVLTQAGDRVLVWNQDDPTENGIFIVSANPWERADDFNNPDNIIPGKLIPILEGSQHGNEVFQLTTSGEIIVGTTPLSFDKVAISHWGEIMGDINLQSDLTNKISTDIQLAVDGLKDGVALEGDTLKKLYDLIQGVVGVSRSVPTYADLPADGKDQENIFVQDASGDSTVTSGWAIYKSIGDQPGGSYVKIAEQEGLDIDLSQFWKTNGSTTLTGATTIDGNNNQLNLNSGPGLTNRTSLVLNDSTPYASLSAITAGGHTSQVYVSLSQLFLTYRGSDGGPESTIALVDSGMLVIDARNQTGLKYNDDYSANHTSRSVIDKGYADSTYFGTSGGNKTMTDSMTFNVEGYDFKSSNTSLGGSYDIQLGHYAGNGITFAGLVQTSDGIQWKGFMIDTGAGYGAYFGTTSNGIGTDGSGIRILDDGSMTIYDLNNTKGIVYAADYAANFVDRSLVDKAYVDAQVANLPASGNNAEIQFNDNGTLGADSNLKWDGDLNVINGNINIKNISTQSLLLTNNSSDKLVKIGAGTSAIQLYDPPSSLPLIQLRPYTGNYIGLPLTVGSTSGAGENVLNIVGTTSITLPLGTTAQRPSTPVASMLRFNTDTNQLEVYDGTQWVSPGGAASVEERVMFDSNLDTSRTVYYNGVISFGNFSFDNATDGLASLEFQTSTDGSTWTSHGTITAPGAPPAALNTWVASNGSGNWYLRLVATYKAGASKITGTQWTFAR